MRKKSLRNFEPGQLAWLKKSNDYNSVFYWHLMGDGTYDPDTVEVITGGTPLLIIRKSNRRDLNQKWKDVYKTRNTSMYEYINSTGWICLYEDQPVLFDGRFLRTRRTQSNV